MCVCAYTVLGNGWEPTDRVLFMQIHAIRILLHEKSMNWQCVSLSLTEASSLACLEACSLLMWWLCLAPPLLLGYRQHNKHQGHICDFDCVSLSEVQEA